MVSWAMMRIGSALLLSFWAGYGLVNQAYLISGICGVPLAGERHSRGDGNGSLINRLLLANLEPFRLLGLQVLLRIVSDHSPCPLLRCFLC